MGTVTHVDFSQKNANEKEWEKTLERLRSCYVDIGALYGDDSKIMLAKAQLMYETIRAMVEKLPHLRIEVKIPEGLDEKDQVEVMNAIKESAVQGIEMAVDHAVCIVVTAGLDLCTSRLAKRPPR
jgi:hypothetical protein